MYLYALFVIHLLKFIGEMEGADIQFVAQIKAMGIMSMSARIEVKLLAR